MSSGESLLDSFNDDNFTLDQYLYQKALIFKLTTCNNYNSSYH